MECAIIVPSLTVAWKFRAKKAQRRSAVAVLVFSVCGIKRKLPTPSHELLENCPQSPDSKHIDQIKVHSRIRHSKVFAVILTFRWEALCSDLSWSEIHSCFAIKPSRFSPFYTLRHRHSTLCYKMQPSDTTHTNNFPPHSQRYITLI